MVFDPLDFRSRDCVGDALMPCPRADPVSKRAAPACRDSPSNRQHSFQQEHLLELRMPADFSSAFISGQMASWRRLYSACIPGLIFPIQANRSMQKISPSPEQSTPHLPEFLRLLQQRFFADAEFLSQAVETQKARRPAVNQLLRQRNFHALQRPMALHTLRHCPSPDGRGTGGSHGP